MSVEMRSTVKERGAFTSSSLASKILFTLQVRLKEPMPWEAQVRVIEEPSTTGSAAGPTIDGYKGGVTVHLCHCRLAVGDGG